MRNETILERTDGSKVKIDAHAFYSNSTDNMTYKIEVYIQDKGKRKWKPAINTDDYTYRRLEMEQRRVYEHEQNLGFVTLEEMKAAQMSLWEKMKP